MNVLELLQQLLNYAEVYGDVPVMVEDYEHDTTLAISAVQTEDSTSAAPYILIK